MAPLVEMLPTNFFPDVPPSLGPELDPELEPELEPELASADASDPELELAPELELDELEVDEEPEPELEPPPDVEPEVVPESELEPDIEEGGPPPLLELADVPGPPSSPKDWPSPDEPHALMANVTATAKRRCTQDAGFINSAVAAGGRTRQRIRARAGFRAAADGNAGDR
jgi:hypothetical protein